MDPAKCTSPLGIYGRTKGSMHYSKQGAEYYIETIWNVYRPYLKCACKFLDPSASCESSIIWLDHAVWYVLNNLERLFLDKDVIFHLSILCSWLGGKARTLVLAQITFIYFRGLMHDVLKEIQGKEPRTILTNYEKFPGIKLINSLLNPHLEHESTPSFPPRKISHNALSTPSTFTSFLSPSTGNRYSGGRARSYTNRGRGRNYPVRNLQDF